MAEYSDLVDSVRPELLGCSDPIMERKAKEVVKRFCRSTHIIQRWTELMTDEGEDEFVASPPNGYSIMSILKVSDGVNEIRRCEYNLPGINDFNLDKPDLYGYVVIPPDMVKFMYSVGDDVFYALLALAPSESSSRFDDMLYDRFNEELSAGIKSDLMKQQNTRWYDPNLAMHYGNIYRHGVNRARGYVLKNFTNETLNIKPREFGGV